MSFLSSSNRLSFFLRCTFTVDDELVSLSRLPDISTKWSSPRLTRWRVYFHLCCTYSLCQRGCGAGRPSAAGCVLESVGCGGRRRAAAGQSWRGRPVPRTMASYCWLVTLVLASTALAQFGE